MTEEQKQPTAHFLHPDIKQEKIKTYHHKNLQSLVIETGLNNTTYSKTTLKNIKEAIIVVFE